MKECEECVYMETQTLTSPGLNKKEIKIKLCNYKLHRIQRLCDVIEKCKIADKIRLNKKLKKVLK